MWFILWIFALIFVHIQFRYCSAVAVTALKLFEATIIVICIRVWYEMPEDMEPFYKNIRGVYDTLLNFNTA